MFEKAEMCLGLWPLKSQPISRMAFTACSLTSLPGLMSALQTCMPRLADIFNMASAIGLRLAFLMQTKSIFKISLTFRIDPSVWSPKKSTEAQVLCDRPREFAQCDQEES